jgi:hypothetical protein
MKHTTIGIDPQRVNELFERIKNDFDVHLCPEGIALYAKGENVLEANKLAKDFQTCFVPDFSTECFF